MKNSGSGLAIALFCVCFYFFLVESDFTMDPTEKKLNDTIEAEGVVITDLYYKINKAIDEGDYEKKGCSSGRSKQKINQVHRKQQNISRIG